MRILIVKLSSLGDVVHAMPVVHDIRASRPGASIDWVVEPAFAPLVQRVAGIDRVIRCALRRWRGAWWTQDTRAEWRAFKAELQAEPYDAVLDLQGLTKSVLIARMARCSADGVRFGLANRTLGSGWEPAARWLADRAIHVRPEVHALDRSREFAALALRFAPQPMPVFGLQTSALPATSLTAAFVHGTSRDDKLWPENRWIELGRKLVLEGWRIALPQGSQQEGARSLRLSTAIGAQHCEPWPQMGLDALLDRLNTLQGVIGVDSGPSHMAVALDLPHVQIYNFPTAWRTGPQPAHGRQHQVSVGGEGPPSVDSVWSAWQAASHAARHAA